MANVKTIWIHNSGTPVTTGAYDLRVSPYSSTGVTGTHSSGGNWVFAGLDDSASYKLYDTTGGTEVTSITGGSTNTLSFYDTALTNYVDKTTASAQTLSGQLIASSAGYKTDVIVEKTSANGISIDGLSIKDSAIRGTNPAFADVIAEYSSGVGVTIDGVLIKDDIYTGHTGRALLASANTLIVDANRSADITGYVYNDLQSAIDYAQLQTPSGTSRWTILIVPHKNTASYAGYTGALTLYKYIDLVGLGMIMMQCILGYSGTWTGGTFSRFKNLLVRPLVDTNLTVRGIEAENCHFGVEEDSLTPVLSLENSQFKDSGFWRFGTVSTAPATTGGNYIMNCIGNVGITWDATDTVWGYNYVNDATKYFKLT